MLDFKVQLALGDQELTEAEWRKLLAAEEGLVLLRGQWVEVDRQKLTEALDHWKQLEAQAEDGLSFIEGMRLLAGAPARPGRRRRRPRRRARVVVRPCRQVAGRHAGEAAEPREPRARRQPGGDLKATLRKYQETGVNWLWFLSSLGLGACLADDMGLGKTIQVLALLLALKKQAARQAVAPGAAGVAAGQLEGGDGPLHARRCGRVFVHPSETPEGRTRPDGRPTPARPCKTPTWC